MLNGYPHRVRGEVEKPSNTLGSKIEKDRDCPARKLSSRKSTIHAALRQYPEDIHNKIITEGR